MVKILCIGDPHIKVDNQQRVAKLISETLRYISINKPDLVVVMGDTLDRHRNIHMTPLTVANKWFNEIRKITKLVIIKGNHDALNNSAHLTEESPFYANRFWENTYMIDDQILYLEFDQMIFGFVPYIYPGKMMDEIYKNPNWRNIRAFFGHQELKGCRLGIKFSEVGDDWKSDYPLFISGHIHDYHTINNNIIYVGTPMNTNYGETSDKSISLFEFNKNDHTHDRIRLNIPNKKQIELRTEQINSYNLENTDDIIKIIITGPEEEVKTIMKSQKIISWKQLGHKVIANIKYTASEIQYKRSELSFIDHLISSLDANLQNLLTTIINK